MPKVGMEPIRRDQIRRAAAKIIAKRGFDGTTLMEIAKAARVSTGTINHYYDNKLAVLVDTLIYVSEWFQSRTREAIARSASTTDKLRAIVRVGIFESGADGEVGQTVWLWAMAESIRFKALRTVIEERRRLFQHMIADVVREMDAAHNMRESDIVELAAEIDAFVNGLYIHQVTGENRIDALGAERSLLAMVRGRAERIMHEAAAAAARGERHGTAK
jgi:TetR/AcrR family transcriptional repressor of bet genes